MSEANLISLESQIDELIALCAQLKKENTLLKERQDQLVEERAHLIEKTDLARTRVEAILTRLRAMDQD